MGALGSHHGRACYINKVPAVLSPVQTPLLRLTTISISVALWDQSPKAREGNLAILIKKGVTGS